MKIKLLFLLAIILFADKIKGQSFQEPQWQMPLYFEDGTGARDTIWFGYDPSADWAGPTIDLQFDEGWVWIDTSDFNVYLYEKGQNYPEYPIQTDSVRIRDISSWPFPQTKIGFCKGVFPLTLRWDSASLNQKSIPYPDISPRPRARMDLNFEAFADFDPYCINSIDRIPLMILTNYYLECDQCTFYDSLVMISLVSGYEIGELIYPNMFVTLMPHDFSCSWDDKVKNELISLNIYPNPVVDYLSIESANIKDMQIIILDLNCNIRYNNIFRGNDNKINLQYLTSGLYFIEIKSSTFSKMYKFIKL